MSGRLDGFGSVADFTRRCASASLYHSFNWWWNAAGSGYFSNLIVDELKFVIDFSLGLFFLPHLVITASTALQ